MPEVAKLTIFGKICELDYDYKINDNALGQLSSTLSSHQGTLRPTSTMLEVDIDSLDNLLRLWFAEG